MNTASEDLTRHLRLLRQKLEHKNEYELALYYFLEEFASDLDFMQHSVLAEDEKFLQFLTHAATEALNSPVVLDCARMFWLNSHRFLHGNARIADRVLLFFYFQTADIGLAALIPGKGDGVQVARFSLGGRVGCNPALN
jgi:hypothetical protein